MNVFKKLSHGSSLGYMVQLDSLRTLAVFGVMIEHYIPGDIFGSILPYWKSNLSLGRSAVTLFLVLSGFLITGILLRARDTINPTTQSARFTIWIFYIRRFLRIAPIYYLTIIVTGIAFKQVRNTFFWHLTYTTNILVFIRGTWDETSTHLWTLCLEEQFYLIWPCLMLFVPKKYLLKVIFTTIILSVTSRFILLYGFNLNTTQITVFPLASMDQLGLGALLGFYTYNPERFNQAKRNLCNFGLWVCLPLVIFLNNIDIFSTLLRPTVLAIFCTWLINGAAKGFGGIGGRVLELKPLVFLGKISYGIYVFHYFMIPVFAKVYELKLLAPLPLPIEAVLKSLLTLAIAIPSWLLIEKPINDLKRNFSYKKS